MQCHYLKSAIYWRLLLLVVPVCLGIAVMTGQTQYTWFYHNIGAFLTLAILLPVLEEIVFRGFVQEKLAAMTRHSRLGGLTVANILTSLLFMALHFINHPPVWALLVLFPSLVFGYSKDRYVSLGAPVLLHVVYNSSYYMTFGAT